MQAISVLYGEMGGLIVAAAILFACLSTSIGLVAATAQFSHKIYPRLSYLTYVFIYAAFSAMIANVGLTQLIAISLPVLLAIYPIAIVLVILSFFDRSFDRKPYVYIIALSLTGIISIFDGLRSAGISFNGIDKVFSFLPFHEQGIGWIVPAILGTLIGFIMVRMKNHKN